MSYGPGSVPCGNSHFPQTGSDITSGFSPLRFHGLRLDHERQPLPLPLPLPFPPPLPSSSFCTSLAIARSVLSCDVLPLPLPLPLHGLLQGDFACAASSFDMHWDSPFWCAPCGDTDPPASSAVSGLSAAMAIKSGTAVVATPAGEVVAFCSVAVATPTGEVVAPSETGVPSSSAPSAAERGPLKTGALSGPTSALDSGSGSRRVEASRCLWSAV
mmetsp:Transcript_143968/g.249196  ORF Transcript_143968/g.249196 Transcript_143968/m.249196 type:complete len:215 (-) Transcript_143968:2001-2645(-)